MLLPHILALALHTTPSVPPICPNGQQYEPSLKSCQIITCAQGQEKDPLSGQCRPQPPSAEQCLSQGLFLDSEQGQCEARSFAAYCSEESLDYEREEQTISRIINDLAVHDCYEADSLLRKTKSLRLEPGRLKIESIRPIGSLAYLEHLELNQQRISDLEPLAHFKKLQRLSLRYNQIIKLDVLLNLPKLTWVDLTGNPIDPQDPQLKALKSKIKVVFEEPTTRMEPPE
jgi:hypothetical protein